jgi:hypothetical protein
MKTRRISAPEPFLGSTIRVKRAGQLLGTLKRQEQAWADAHRNYTGAIQNPETKRIDIRVVNPDAYRLARVSVTVGEIAYNLRSALDYIVFEIASTNVGKSVDGTQFPIESTRDGFQRRVTGKNKAGKDVGGSF